RFNFGADVQPGRDQLAFSTRWDGWLVVPSDGPRRVRIESIGPARLTLDGSPVVETGSADGLQGADARPTLSAGLHTLRVEYSRPVARVPRLLVAWDASPELRGELQPLGGGATRWTPDARDYTAWRVAGVVPDGALGALVIAWLALGCWSG